MRLRFTKMHGAGNDFVVLDATRTPLALTPEQARRLADRRRGVGADQILVVEPSATPGVYFRYRIWNGGSGDEVEQCGNGARCFVRYVHDHGLSAKRTLVVETTSTRLELKLADDGDITVDMSVPGFDLARLPFDAAGLAPRREGDFALWPLEGAEFALLSMGNPHAVCRVADVDAAPVAVLGARIERHPRFPQHVNVGFMQVLARDTVALRVHERGAGETPACGTGACAAVVAGIRLGWLERSVAVRARGGTLRVDWPHADSHVQLSGPAVTVFEGEIDL